ncbi:hypothetical protein SAMN05421630_11043 [Prauserella marina]|uniref:Uncharacterized protein n=1 Tax=Prauserella marina TaxID=530584 RepID=A0A1G6VW64_9PSEU|nr:hypothetical protein DES30_10843 [Prauserella marina]SDD57872.1 hypothetical protein SAMN05421630_11043 [Prauserella marina]
MLTMFPFEREEIKRSVVTDLLEHKNEMRIRRLVIADTANPANPAAAPTTRASGTKLIEHMPSPRAH